MYIMSPGREPSYSVCQFPFKLYTLLEDLERDIYKKCNEEETYLPIGASSKPLMEEESETLHNLPGGWLLNSISSFTEILCSRQTEYGSAQSWQQKQTTSI